MANFCCESLLLLLWDKFTFKRNTLKARALLQKTAVENSLFVLVVFLFRTHGGISECALISNTHMHTVTLSCPNWGVPEIITLSLCYP